MTSSGRIALAAGMGVRDLARRPLILILLVVTPIVFITRAIANTEPLARHVPIDNGAVVTTTMRDLHGANMTVIAVAFLAGLLGVFLMNSAIQADGRLVRAGFGAMEAVTARLGVLVACTLLVVTVSVATTARDFTPQQWSWFLLGNVLIGVTFAGLGALASALLGRVGATYLLLFVTMLDVGIVQNPMFGSGRPPDWSFALPGHFGTRMAMYGAFSTRAGIPVAALVGALIWCTAALGLTVWTLTVRLRRS